ncbi:MAG TPA: PDZ domain-containing protein, partial [Prosthecobacter sp.]
MSIRRLSVFSGLLLLAAVAAQAEAPRPTLPAEQRTNGRHTLAAVTKLQPLTTACTASIENVRGGDTICTATIVGEDGYLLTKASEVPDVEKARARFADGRQVSLREVRREVRFDLLLLQAVGIGNLPAVSFGAAKPLTQGQWLCSTAEKGKEPRIGIVSARSRRIPGTGAALGIRMEEKTLQGVKGVRITGIASESPAEAAGLHEGDVLVNIAGEAVAQYRRVHELVSKRQPGEII